MKKVSSLCLVALVCFAPAALAQECDAPHCGPYSEDNEEPCMGPDDPFCSGDGDGGITYEHTGGCFACQYIPPTPDGEPSYYFCDDLGPVDGNGNPSKCSDYSYGCDMSGQCLLV